MEYRQRLLTLTETAALLQCSVAVVKRFVKAGELPARMLGAEYRVALPDLARFLTLNITLHKAEAGAGEGELLAWLERAVARLRPRYSPPEMETSRSGGERFARDT